LTIKTKQEPLKRTLVSRIIFKSPLFNNKNITMQRNKKVPKFIARQHKKVRCQWLTAVILATQEVEIRRIAVQSQSGKQFSRPYLNISKTKRVGEVAKVLEHLPSKCKTLGSNPSTSTTKKEKKA
jgi:hypothetical protein